MTEVMPIDIFIPYSLGDAIDWKLLQDVSTFAEIEAPLLARGRDRLETISFLAFQALCASSPTR